MHRLPSHTRIPRNIHKHLRTIPQLRLLLQGRSILQPINPLLPIEIAPIRQQQPGQNRIDPNFRTLRMRKTLHEMNLRRLGDTIRHTAPTKRLACDTARKDENATIRISVQSWEGLFEQGMVSFDVGVPALVPLIVRHGVEVFETGEFGETSVADDDVEASKGGDCGFDAVLNVGDYATVAFHDYGLDVVG